MIYLLDSNVFMHLANGAKGAEKIEARIVAIGRSSLRSVDLAASE